MANSSGARPRYLEARWISVAPSRPVRARLEQRTLDTNLRSMVLTSSINWEISPGANREFIFQRGHEPRLRTRHS